jgi:hypothetical protein
MNFADSIIMENATGKSFVAGRSAAGRSVAAVVASLPAAIYCEAGVFVE